MNRVFYDEDVPRGRGRFARHLVESQAEGHPELRRWQGSRPESLRRAEKRLRSWLRGRC